MDSKRQLRRAYALRETMIAMSPPLVLLAEDDVDVRCLVTTALRKEGWSVVEARDGADLLEQIGSALLFGNLRGDLAPVGLVISDVRMPGHDGLEVLAHLRRSEIDVAVILMTAYPDAITRGRAEGLGVDAFLQKPFEIDHLCSLVRDILTRAGGAEGGAAPG
jgi:CheY-like chemotaxis protein